MSYEEFEQEIKEAFYERYGDSLTIQSVTVPKNNQVMLRGIRLSAPNRIQEPVIYLDTAYKDYQIGPELSTICDLLFKTYNHSLRMSNENIEDLLSFEKIKDRIVYRVVNYHLNEERLSEMPHKKFLDLAITLCVILDCSENGTASLTISDFHMQRWNVSKKDLFDLAEKNTSSMFPAEVKPIHQVCREHLLAVGDELLADKLEELYPLEDYKPVDDMQVITNQYNYYGAACILYEGMLDSVGDYLGENFYILPSSIHECLAIKESQAISPIYLSSMIQDVNQTRVDAEEHLSNHPYYYNRTTKLLTAA